MIRRATASDALAISEMIDANARAGNTSLLERPLSDIERLIDDFHLAEVDGQMVGCAALHAVSPDLAEIRSVAVNNEYRGNGLGSRLVESMLSEARTTDLARVFMLVKSGGAMSALGTRLGFSEVPMDDLPHKVWTDCLNCPKYSNCDEIALLLTLDPSRVPADIIADSLPLPPKHLSS